MESGRNEEVKELRQAISSIASEIQRFHDAEINDQQNKLDCEDVLGQIIACKCKLKRKKIDISNLRKKLKLACLAAKTVSRGKANKSMGVKCSDSGHEYLQRNVDAISNFIELGYKELQKIRTDCEEHPSILMQLKKLTVCCGEYYAEFCNKNEQCQQLIRRNRSLTNKINILEFNLQGVSEQIKFLHNHYSNLRKFVDCKQELLTGKGVTPNFNKTNVGYNKTNFNFEIGKGNPLKDPKPFDFQSRMVISKQILIDQSSLLEELQNVSLEIMSASPSYTQPEQGDS